MKDGKHIDDKSIIRYYKNGKLHREEGPSVIYPDNSKFWYINGRCHREDYPAMEYGNGDKSWYYYGCRADNEKEFYNDKWRKEILLDLV